MVIGAQYNDGIKCRRRADPLRPARVLPDVVPLHLPGATIQLIGVDDRRDADPRVVRQERLEAGPALEQQGHVPIP